MDESVTVAVAATIEDQVGLNEVLLGQPEARRRAAASLGLLVFVVPTLGLLIGVLVASLAAGGLSGLPAAIRDVGHDSKVNIALPWLLLCLAMALVGGLLRLFRRPLLRRRLRALLLERPGIDPADPLMTERVRCAFGPEGYAVESAGYTHRIPWSGIRGLDETDALLVVRTSWYYGYVLPKRDIAPADLAAIRAIGARHLGVAPARGPSGP